MSISIQWTHATNNKLTINTLEKTRIRTAVTAQQQQHLVITQFKMYSKDQKISRETAT